MSGCLVWYVVWKGPRVDESFETLVRAKKHAAWLHWTFAKTEWYYQRVTLTCKGEEIDFRDYEFKNGDSRRVKYPDRSERRATLH